MRAKRSGAMILALTFVAGSVIAIAASGATGSATGSDDPSGRRAEVFGMYGTTQIRVSEGSEVARGRRDQGHCVFDQRVGVVVHLLEGDVGPEVRWRLDDQCRMIITEIRWPDSDQPPDGGTEPSEVPAPGSERP